MINSDAGLSEQAQIRKRIIVQLDRLPALPSFLSRIIDCANDDQTSAHDLKEIILQDQSVTARVLKLANSAYYGYHRKISTVTDAIVVVGFQAVVDLATSLALTRMFEGVTASDEFDVRQCWLHTLATAEATRLTARRVQYQNLERAYLVGLLHDLGKVVLAQMFRKEFEDAVFEARAHSWPLCKVEQSVFEFHHGEAGNWLGEKWNLPNSILAGMRYHHEPQQAPQVYKPESLLAHCGNYFAHQLKIGISGSAEAPKWDLDSGAPFDLPTVEYEHICMELEQHRDKLQTVIELLDE